jgi:parallel beta-helix repeat protein
MRQRLRSRLTYARVAATFVSLAVLLTSAVITLVAFGDGRAVAGTPLSCGDTITADATLDHNLVNCPNNGIIIGADDVTLDLNHHAIDGDGTPAAGCDPNTEFCDVGVLNDGHDGVAVVHGSVRQFDAGLVVGEARHNRLLGVSSSRNLSFGIVVVGSALSLIQNSSGTGSTAPVDGTGLGLFSSHRIRIIHNSFRDNAGDHGMVTNDSNNSLIKGNRFSGNDGEGMLMEGGERNRIRRNRFARNKAGITLGPGSHNVIARNRVSRGRDGIRIEAGLDNLVAHNVVTHARAGIRLGISNPFLGGAHNVVRGNLVKGSRLDGFLVNAKDDHSLLRHNRARGAGDDGFDIESRSATLTRNRAMRNGDLGIEAVRGVIDGGGNVARHNGDPRQCTHVMCR